MAVNSTFYIDSADFETATAVYLDSLLTYIAPDGYYRVGTVVRQQSGGILLAVGTCAACTTPCGGVISAGGQSGVYQVNLDVGSLDTGAILIRFNPQSVPDGIRVTYDGVVYNKLSSPVHGVSQSPNYGHYTILGNSSNVGNCSSWYPAGTTLTSPIKIYNPNNPAIDKFEPTDPPTTQVNVIVGTSSAPTLQPDYFLYPTDVGDCWMVIPKPNTTPNTLLIEIIGPCTSTGWGISAFCPEPLPSFASSLKLTVPIGEVPCSTPINQTYYWAKVSASTTRPSATDYVFSDENGEFPLLDGIYLLSKNISNDIYVIEVEDGIVIGTYFLACI